MALQYVRDNIFITASGSRRLQGVPQVLILLSGGRSFDNVEVPSTSLRETGVLIFSVGSGDSDSNELQKISSDPNFTLSVADFTYLPNVQEQLLSVITSSLTGTTSIFPTTIVDYEVSRKDVVFLLDGSDGSRNGFPAMIDFVLRLVENFNFEDSMDRVAIVQYRDSDSNELQKISSDPNFTLSVADFTYLPNVQEQLLSVITSSLTGTTSIFPTTIVESHVPRRDIVFLLDGSDSSRNGFPATRDFVQRLVERLTIGKNKDHVSVVQFSRDAYIHFYLNTYTTKEDIVGAVKSLRHKGGMPLNIGAALQYVRDNVFTASSGSRRLEGVPQMLILMSGGRSNDNIDIPASILKNLGILIFGIGSMDSDNSELERISFDPSYALTVSDFTKFPDIQEQLLNSLDAVAVPMIKPSPASPVDYEVSRKDVVFLLDGSDGSRNGFPAMIDFVLRLVENFNFEDSMDRVAIVQYSTNAVVHFYLNTYSTRDEILNAIKTVKHKGGRHVNTGSALQYVRENVFTDSAGSRHQQGVPNILILLRGSRSTDNVDQPASALKESGVLIFGVGPKNLSSEMERIANGPSYAQTVSELSDLGSVQQQFYTSLRSALLDTMPVIPTVRGSRRLEGVPQMLILMSGGRSNDNIDIPASILKNLGILIFGIGSMDSDNSELERISFDPSYALTVSDFTKFPDIQEQLLILRCCGSSYDQTLTSFSADQRFDRKDVVFLLDGSDGTKNYFPAMRDFIQNVVGRLNVSEERDHVSVVQFSRDPDVHFYLNTYTTKESVLNNVRGLRHKGGRPLNTGMALQYVRDNIFITASGSRRLQGVPQWQDFTYLPNVQEQLLSVITSSLTGTTSIFPTTIVESHVPRRDIVFLLDGSNSNRNGFPATRDFVQRLVERLNIGKNKDHVSVVQFSRDAYIHFYLNTYTTKEDIVEQSKVEAPKEECP
ncbi:Collagen alpha-3(VI) chain [Bagarius yarrelli]|uniref:Collagen alpha-3(VI) chain n=1 Tax=Bagarius yarrelli TaxID=175774 RepID=A0A556UZ65_BAGYA|nr:Collagen alpha-3(VI) chain [Bagarius yarrelli]